MHIYIWKIRSHDYVLICTMYFNCASQKEFHETVKTIPVCIESVHLFHWPFTHGWGPVKMMGDHYSFAIFWFLRPAAVERFERVSSPACLIWVSSVMNMISPAGCLGRQCQVSYSWIVGATHTRLILGKKSDCSPEEWNENWDQVVIIIICL